MKGMNEGEHQEALFEWAQWRISVYPELKFLYHTPNGGKRDSKTAMIMKREGVKPGVPDVTLPVPKGRYHGLYIEMKVGNNKTTEKQDEWLSFLSSQGYFTAICYHWRVAADLIENYLNGELEKYKDFEFPIILKPTEEY